MLLTISEETSVKKLVSPRYQTIAAARGRDFEFDCSALTGAREKRRTQSIVYMRVSGSGVGFAHITIGGSANGWTHRCESLRELSTRSMATRRDVGVGANDR